MTKKTRFWCFQCKTNKPVSEKSPHKVKPPHMCVSCAESLGEMKKKSVALPRKAVETRMDRTADFLESKGAYRNTDRTDATDALRDMGIFPESED